MNAASSSPSSSRSPSFRRYSLPILQPKSPFLLPSRLPPKSWSNPSSRPSPSSPNTTFTASPSSITADHSDTIVSTAYIALSSSADLIHLMYLERERGSMAEPQCPKMVGGPSRSHSTTTSGERMEMKAKQALFDDLEQQQESASHPLLSREHIADLRDTTRMSTSNVDTAAAVSPFDGQSRSIEPSNPRLPALDDATPRLGSPISFDTPTARPHLRKHEHRPWTVTTNNSGYGSVATEADFPLPAFSDTGPMRDDAYIWPIHGSSLRSSAFEGLAESSSNAGESGSGREPAILRPHEYRQTHTQASFMRMSRASGSTTFSFGPADLGTRISIATDLTSDYTPSVAAPSSIVRRTAAWASKITDTVVEEEEPADEHASSSQSKAIGNKTRRRPPSPSIATTEPTHILVSEDIVLTPTTSSSTHHTSSSGKRVSFASGDTFGIHRRRYSTSSPIVEAREEDDMAFSYQKAGSGYSSDGEADVGRRNKGSVSHRPPLQSATSPNMHIRHEPYMTGGFTVTIGKPMSPPSSGTPLRRLREEKYENQHDDWDLHPHGPLSPRLINKVDQLLGRGAYEAGMAMEAEKKILQEALERSVTTHSSTTRKRSGSIDSNHSSLHPSIADSATRLIPLSYPHPPADRVDNDTSNIRDVIFVDKMSTKAKQRPEPVEISTSNKLTAEQRQTLLRRVRVLEKRLGEPLKEDETGKWVVQPSTTGQGVSRNFGVMPSQNDAQNVAIARQANVITQLSRSKTIDSAWPRDILDQDEDQQDRAQRRRQLAKLNKLLGTVMAPDQLAEQSGCSARASDDLGSPSDGVSFMTFEDRPGLPRRGSDSSGGNVKDSWTTKIRQSMGRKSHSAKDMYHIGDDQSFIDMRKASKWKTHKPTNSTPTARVDGYTPAQAYAFGLSQIPSDLAKKAELSEQEKLQARKRTQKLNRVFGDVPPQALYHPSVLRARTATPMPSASDRNGVVDAINISLQALLHLAENHPQQLDEIVDAIADGDLTEPSSPPTWPKRAPISPPRPYRSSTAAEFEILPRGSSSPSPPSPILQTPHPPPPTRPAHEIDHTLLSPVLDTNPSPSVSQAYFNPNSREARRKRTGKLSHFFGESIDFDRPPPLPLKRKSRKEVLDAVIGEMWRSVVAENRNGSVQREDLDQVGTLIASLKTRGGGTDESGAG